jgi:integrase
MSHPSASRTWPGIPTFPDPRGRVHTLSEPRPDGSREPRLLDKVRLAIRARHYSRRTEVAYVLWVRRFILFHKKQHPSFLGEPEISEFLSSLATRGKVSPSTQNQALSALLFLYREVLHQDLKRLEDVVRAKRARRLPTVLTRQEVTKILGRLEGAPRLLGTLLYGSGLRLLEACRLRVQDVDFDRNQILVRAGKGNKDRRTMLPAAIKPELVRHLAAARDQHERDLRSGAGWVELPNALRVSIPTPAASGGGSGSFQRPVTTTIARPASAAGIISTRRCSRRPS